MDKNKTSIQINHTEYEVKTETALRAYMLNSAIDFFCLDGIYKKYQIDAKIVNFSMTNGQDEKGFCVKVYANIEIEIKQLELNDETIEDMYEWFLTHKYA